jgi:hypothetical protein
MVNQTNVIDIASIENGEDLVLTISDHLEWDERLEHLFILQEKINRYLAFIEGGELESHIPAAKGKKPVISIVALYHPNESALEFLERARLTVEGAGVGFRFCQKHFNSK